MRKFLLIGVLLSFFLPSLIWAADTPKKTEEVARLELQVINVTMEKYKAEYELLKIEQAKATKVLRDILVEKNKQKEVKNKKEKKKDEAIPTH